jgi:hypothetical protein
MISCVIHAFYQRFGYNDHAFLEQVLRDGVEDLQGKLREHIYSYEEMGFSREQILTAYADIFTRFGFDRRDPATIPLMEEIASGSLSD